MQVCGGRQFHGICEEYAGAQIGDQSTANFEMYTEKMLNDWFGTGAKWSILWGSQNRGEGEAGVAYRFCGQMLTSQRREQIEWRSVIVSGHCQAWETWLLCFITCGSERQ